MKEEVEVSVMPDIIKMRKEWKKKYSDTRIFDYFYMGLCGRVRKSCAKAAIEGKVQKGAEDAH